MVHYLHTMFSLVAFAFFAELTRTKMPLSMASALFAFGILTATPAFANQGLRGAPVDARSEVTSLAAEEIPRILIADDDVIILVQSLAFLLGLIALMQLGLIASFIHHRSKRVLEFAQPLAIGVMLGAGLAITAACYLFIYTSNIGCAIREPIIFISITIMGATIAGRAWRISTLFNNPLVKIGSNRLASSEIGHVERARQFVLSALTVLTSGSCTSRGNQTQIHTKITIVQLMQAITIMTIPSLLLQVVIITLSSSRSSVHLVTTDVYGLTVGVHECKSMAAGSWDMYASIILACFPLALAYLLNIRPKSELDELPEIVDERKSLESSFAISIIMFVVTSPIISMSINPNVKMYATLAATLVLQLSMCHSIGVEKVMGSMSSNMSLQKSRNSFNSGNNSGSPLASQRMAEMYRNIGRKEDSIQLIDETLNSLKKGASNSVIPNIGQKEGKEEIGAGFTRNDLKSFDHNTLDMVINLLKLKARAMEKVDSKISAAISIDALRIFENCPAASKLKDVSLIFPVYNWVRMLIKGGTIDQDDTFSLEVDLAKRYCHEAQVQAYHYARSVFAMAALWEMKEGRKNKAIERVNFVIENIIPSYDKKDIIGLFSIKMYIIRVLKWCGHADQAIDVYTKSLPLEAGNRFAIGVFYKSMLLVLKFCDGSPVKCSKEDIVSDVELALEFEPDNFGDNIFTADGWSMKSLGAEICLGLASKLPPGNCVRQNLVSKGLRLSDDANQKIQASNGSIKHILAFDAHVNVEECLLNLRKQDNSITRSVIHHQAVNGKTEITMSRSTREINGLAHRLVVKGEDSNSESTENASGKHQKDRPLSSSVNSGKRFERKVTFSQLSSLDDESSEPSIKKNTSSS